MTRTSREGGFTLVEVLTAFAIFALAAGALYEVIVSGLRRSMKAEMEGEAWLVAQSVLAYERAANNWKEGIGSSGTDADLPWTINVEEWADASARRDYCPCYLVTVSVPLRYGLKGGVQLRSVEWTLPQ